jgi:hypothetical protein
MHKWFFRPKGERIANHNLHSTPLGKHLNQGKPSGARQVKRSARVSSKKDFRKFPQAILRLMSEME